MTRQATHRERERERERENAPSLSFGLPLFSFSFSASLSLSRFSLSLCCLSRHHYDATVMVRCDMLSLPLFWSPHVSLSFLSLSLFSLSFFLSLSFSLFSVSLSLYVACRVTTVIVRCDMLSLPRFWSPHVSPSLLQSTRSRSSLPLSSFLFPSLSFSPFLSFLSLSSLPRFWSPHVPPLFLQSTHSPSLALSFFLSRSLSFSLSLFLFFSLSRCVLLVASPL